MPIDARENAEAVAAYLNRMLEAAPEATRALMGFAVPISDELADAVPAVAGASDDGRPQLRAIGLINGLFAGGVCVAERHAGDPPGRPVRLEGFAAGRWTEGGFRPFDG